MLESYQNLRAARTAVSRFLGGQVEPRASLVLELNRAAGKLLGTADVTAFLDAIAIEGGLLEADMASADWQADDSTMDGSQRFGAFSAVYKFCMDYLVEGSEAELFEAIRALPASSQRKLLTRLNRVWREELVALLVGSRRNNACFEAYKNALERTGISIDKWTKPKTELLWRRSRNRFFATVDDLFASAIDDPQIRAKARADFDSAFDALETARLNYDLWLLSREDTEFGHVSL